MRAKSWFEQEISSISPFIWNIISTFVLFNIGISSWSIADIMRESISASAFVTRGWSIVLSFAKWHAFLSWSFGQTQRMNPVFAQETSIVFSDVSVSTCSIGSVIRNFPFRRNCSFDLHNKINTNTRSQ